ncbi:MAG: hypothetical protein OXD29_02550 [Roseovarius sp.]|nr:hypothetical protein [Roseovarius sp.]
MNGHEKDLQDEGRPVGALRDPGMGGLAEIIQGPGDVGSSRFSIAAWRLSGRLRGCLAAAVSRAPLHGRGWWHGGS